MKEFKWSFVLASSIIIKTKNDYNYKPKMCVEKECQYILSVNWETIQNYEVGFRQFSEYREQKNILNHFYESFPEVVHYYS